MPLVTIPSLVQTFCSLLVLSALGILLSILFVAGVLLAAQLAGHCLHPEICAYLKRNEQGTGLVRRVGLVMLVSGPRALFLYRLSCMLRPTRLAPLLFLLRQINKWMNMCEISPYAEFGPGLQIFHGHGILVCEGVTVGKNAWLFQNVNIGRNYGKIPTIGDNVFLFAGTRVLGGVRVGNNCVLSNNALVVRDVPDDSAVVTHEPVVMKRRDIDPRKITDDVGAI